ncbi:chloramphenicol acetyltransferase [Myroides sp. LoEW2-1]|uniref:chloramphenicol acetyltransferase n=1 Tax=Myroides sp. LoEW2-1 TaxID=2683192 RepID=UPI001325826B|nr:chloramphenicol acetyltransferase [Myroides sp. LoEW2-1]MVX34368.1 chloramphenicol acetyltransferase CAT [Myroides sp. LoEW2-1]
MQSKAIFHPIDLENWPRKPYFEYYHNNLKSKYTVSIKIDITTLFRKYKDSNYKFFPIFLYVIIRAINNSESFRTVIYNGQLGQWSFMQPSFTIFHKDDCSFSDLWSEYHEDFQEFYNIIIQDINTYKDRKGIKIRENQPANLIPISCVPWINFESISQDTIQDSNFLQPIIRFGKYYTEGNKVKISLSIYVNHAIADGYHTSMFLQDIQNLCDHVENWMTP